MPKRIFTNPSIGRWHLVGVTLICAAIVSATAVAFYIFYVPGHTREVRGTIVSFETKANRSRVWSILHVRLESGVVVSATAHSNVTAKIGSQVKLIATEMPIIGIERFRFKEFNDPPADTNPLLKR